VMGLYAVTTISDDHSIRFTSPRSWSILRLNGG
jgi:hypothetical protein